jgi:hypothetical protein
MAMYVYVQSEKPTPDSPFSLWTVGHYAPDGTWHPDSDHESREAAAERVAWLNGDRPMTNTCLDRANPGEPIFVLRAQDELAPAAVQGWATELEELAYSRGMLDAVQPKASEARRIADLMEEYQTANGAKIPD